ncbi:MAG: hypothetical protein PUG60_10395 [Lachnospiraceae bacterium]|nr:hypothetical protein [Lachnospiraceae bacterium]
MTFFIWVNRKKGHAIYNGKALNLLTMFVAIGNIVIEEIKKETRMETQESIDFLVDSLKVGLDSLWKEKNGTN